MALLALFGVLNHLTLKLPDTIGVLLFAMLGSLALLGINALLPSINLDRLARSALGSVNPPAA